MDSAFNKGQSGYEQGNERVGGRGGGGRGFRGTAENAKTKMCNRWLAGDCRFGDRCNFAHGEQELRALPNRGPQEGPGYGGGYGAPRGRGYGGYSRGGPAGGGRGYGRGYGYGGGPGGGYGNYGVDSGPAGGYNNMAGQAPRQQQQRQEQGDDYMQPKQGPNGWLMYFDKTSKEPYYHNPSTGVTTWDRPEEWPQ